MRTGRLYLINDLSGDVSSRIADYNRPLDGQLAVGLRPEMRRLAWLGSDAMVAAGKGASLSDLRRAASDTWRMLIACLPTMKVADLVVGHAEGLSADDVGRLAGLADLANVRIWLVVTGGVSDNLTRLGRIWDMERAAPDALALASSPTAQEAPRVSGESKAPFPTVPRCLFPVFLAEAERQMGEADAERVCRLYRETFERAMKLFAGEELGAPVIGRAITESWVAHPEIEARVVIARAYQCAALRNAYLLQIDVDRLGAIWESMPSADLLTPDQWARLDQLLPRDAAIAVLASLGLTTEEIASLPAVDVTSDAAAVRVAGKVYPVPEPARRFLAGQILLRLGSLTGGDSRFIEGGSTRARIRDVSRCLARVSTVTGMVWRRKNAPWASAAAHWEYRDGFSLARLLV